jgi:hypothetical protein
MLHSSADIKKGKKNAIEQEIINIFESSHENSHE